MTAALVVVADVVVVNDDEVVATAVTGLVVEDDPVIINMIRIGRLLNLNSFQLENLAQIFPEKQRLPA